MRSYGLLGYPLGHSLSPMLHQLIYRETGVEDCVYNLFQVPPEALSQAVPAMRTLGIRGCNVTIPHKQGIIASLDEISPEARRIGAVNTVLLREDGAAWGTNTDYYGFQKQLERGGIPIRGGRFVICGMSGAGRAVRQVLEDEGAAEIVVASTDRAKGIPYSDLAALRGFDVIINCTPLGMHPRVEDCVVDSGIIGRFGAAVDLIYNPERTLFLQRAEEQGLKALGGLLMLVYQGVRSFELWTGLTVDSGAVDRIYRQMRRHFHPGQDNPQ